MLDWTWKGFDIVGTLRYIDGFHEQDANLNDHYVEHRWLFDIQASYDFSALVSKPTTTPATPRTKRPAGLHRLLRPR